MRCHYVSLHLFRGQKFNSNSFLALFSVLTIVRPLTEEDFAHWLEGLPEQMRQAMQRDGFEKCRSSWPLQRHALEWRDRGYNDFMQRHLSPDDWAYEQSMREESNSPRKADAEKQ